MADQPTPLPYASLAEMQVWADHIRYTRHPDFIIGPPERPYMRRWYVVPRNPFANVYLHEILRSDDDRALHDHPWRNSSFVISGRYFEHLPDGSVHERVAGWSGEREATDAHRLEVVPDERAVTLFVTGPKVREWGFHCPNGWRHWQEFTGGENGEIIGKGCE